MAKLLTDAVTGALTPRNIAAYFREPIRFLEFVNTITVSAPDPYTQWKIANLAYTVVAGDVLRYDVWSDPMNPGLGAGGIDLVFAGAPFTAAAAGVVDQNALALWGPLNAANTGNWYTRTCSLTPIVGKALTSAQLVNGGDTVGTHRARYRNIRITDAAGTTVRASIWLSGDPTFNVDAGSQSNAGQSAVAYESEGWLGNPDHASFAVGTTEQLRDGVWHAQGLTVFPGPADRSVQDDGIQTGGEFRVQVAVTVREMAPALEFRHNASALTNSYVYWKIAAPAYLVVAGDVLRYEVWTDPKNATPVSNLGIGGVEVDLTAAPTAGRNVPLVDGGAVTLIAPPTGASGQWVSRAISLTPIAGSTISAVDLVNENDTPGSYRALYRNIRITDAAGTTERVAIWKSGAPSFNVSNYATANTSDHLVVPIEAPITTDLTFTSALDLLASPKNVIGRTFELELVSQVSVNGAPAREIRDIRRAKCTKASLKGNVLEMSFADITTTALDALHPSATYTVADFAELFEGHVGKPIADGVGQLVRVPMAWIKKTGGTWRHAICEKRAGMTYTVQTIYRGETEGEVGRIVPATEYTVGSTVGASTFIEVLDVIFTREQLNGSGQPYALTADVLINSGAGTTEARVFSNEVKRLLVKAGLTTDTTTFDAAATYAVTNKMWADAGYVTPKTLRFIIQNLLQIGRAMLGKNDAGSFTVIQDKAGTSVATFMESADPIQVDGVEYADSPAKVSLYYRPVISGTEQWLATPVIRTPAGAMPEARYQNPYIRDHETADRLVDYLSKRDSIGITAAASIHGVQLEPRELITIDHSKELRGLKTWQITEVSRPADKNDLALTLYDAAIHTYTAGTLPSAASNTYTPDYSNTPPLAPTALTVVSNTSAVDASGKAFASVKVRATPPTVNWAKLFVRALNTTTNVMTAPVALELVSGNYETTIGLLLPSQGYTLIFYAQNANGLDGATATTGITAAAYSGAPTAPAAVSGVQGAQDDVIFTASAPAYAHHEAVEWQVSVGGGAFGNVTETSNVYTHPGVSYGTTYAARARFRDKSGNLSGYTTSSNVTPAKKVDDGHVITTGISGVSIANSSINRGRSDTTTGSVSGTLAAGATLQISMEKYTFFPGISCTSGISVPPVLRSNSAGSDDTGQFMLHNDSAASWNYAVYWRGFQP